MFLLALCALKLVNKSSRTESLKTRINSTMAIAWILLQNRQNENFPGVFKDSARLELLINLDAKDAKISVIKWASSFYKVFIIFFAERQAVKYSSTTYVWSTLDGLI